MAIVFILYLLVFNTYVFYYMRIYRNGTGPGPDPFRSVLFRSVPFHWNGTERNGSNFELLWNGTERNGSNLRMPGTERNGTEGTGVTSGIYSNF